MLSVVGPTYACPILGVWSFGATCPPPQEIRLPTSAQAASPQRHTDQELTLAARGSRSVVREFHKSPQAASPQRHTDQELTLAARGSRSVVRES